MTHVARPTPTASSPSPAATLEREFDRCAGSLYRYFAVRTGRADEADELMQQLWIRAQRLAPGPERTVELQLRAVARNLLRTHWRRSAARPAHAPLPAPDVAADLARRLVSEELPPAILHQREVSEQLLLALTALPAADQELLVEHYFHGRSQAMLAEQYGLTERAVEGRLYRARNALRERLQNVEPF